MSETHDGIHEGTKRKLKKVKDEKKDEERKTFPLLFDVLLC